MPLERIIQEGTVDANFGHDGKPTNAVRCADGFKFSAVAGRSMYCSPRPDGYGADAVDRYYEGPYDALEVGFPTARPEPWDQWSEWCEDTGKPTETVYGYVPVDAIRALVALHGGEAR